MSDKVAGEECGGAETDNRLRKGWAGKPLSPEPQDRSSDWAAARLPPAPPPNSFPFLLH